jgi:TRAP-type C4-dicarboxylate transport system substrate-binding protein
MKRAFAALCVAMLATNPGHAQETVELIFNAHQPPQTIGQRISVFDFAERIETESGGTIKVTIPGASLAPSARQVDMVVEGVADMATIASDSLRQSVVLTRLGELPFSSITATAASTAIWEV